MTHTHTFAGWNLMTKRYISWLLSLWIETIFFSSQKKQKQQQQQPNLVSRCVCVYVVFGYFFLVSLTSIFQCFVDVYKTKKEKKEKNLPSFCLSNFFFASYFIEYSVCFGYS